MQDLFAELLWRNSEIDEAADRLRKTLPGFAEAQRDYDSITKQIWDRIGPGLYDQFFSQLMRYSSYEVYAYYSLGLGLREEIARAMFTPQSSTPSPVSS